MDEPTKNLTNRQVETIDALEGEVLEFLKKKFNLTDEQIENYWENDTANDAVKSIMQYVADFGECFGIPEMETYPYITE